MRSGADKLMELFRKLLPAPFTIAVLLTLLAFFAAFFFTLDELPAFARLVHLLDTWERGLWNASMLVFTVQMMLLLVLGHVLALSPPVRRLIDRLAASVATSAERAVVGVGLLTMLMGLFNWGFGLVFGAIFARRVGEMAMLRRLPLNYPLLGAAGYTGMLVWHGGLSGSALIKVAEPGHLKSLMADSFTDEQLSALPDFIGASDTVFSAMNLTATVVVLAVVSSVLYLLAKKSARQDLRLDSGFEMGHGDEERASGAERMDVWRLPALLFGALLLGMSVYRVWVFPEPSTLGFITPNWINLSLFGLALVFHGSIRRFLAAVEQAIGGASGILIQFPLYFGIMALITTSGLGSLISEQMVASSSPTTYPLWTFLSAAVVNVFVPSGGGQWAVQGALIVGAAQEMNLSLSKCILALAYGDQLTNMLQPFWALPLLAITGLKARSIAPYTLLLMLAAGAVYAAVLLVFV